MGVASYPASGGGLSSVVKSLQTGTASSAGTVTITAVNTSKTVVYATSTGSAGTVAASGSINAANGSTSGISTSAMYGNLYAIEFNALYTTAFQPTPLILSGYSAYSAGTFYQPLGGIVGTQVGNSGSGSFAYSAATRYGSTSISGNFNTIYDSTISTFGNAMNTNGANVSMNSTSLTGGTTSGLYSAQYGAVLTNSTTITVTGPCSYQVVEYY
jgi:hypothetical protein